MLSQFRRTNPASRTPAHEKGYLAIIDGVTPVTTTTKDYFRAQRNGRLDARQIAEFP